MKTLFFLAVLITLLCCLSKYADAQENECVQNGGHCIFMAAAVACYHQLQMSCGSNSYFCCKPNICSLEETERVVDLVGQTERTPCEGQGNGRCLSIYSRIFCPQKLDLPCGDNSLYCCQMNKIARALEKTECAKLETGVCLSVYSEIYCPKKLDSSCGDKSLYCCQLG
ncbi:hypothetical protein Bpfe_009218 [Biomphalaria pfeifferi]|uniref:Uncharacterized protein n=1 Tax=Biomphalaria pfeifferi TaxID=112525 RepID=A0AAD8FDY1_BIOPF|nr:hypothetical protein Bpfe_009218 [Biomphalaria pfeifferi]